MRKHYAEAAEPLSKDRPHRECMRNLIHEIMSPRPQWDEMGCGIKNSLGQNIVAKDAMGYAFSAVAPSRYSSDSLTIIDIAV